MKKIITLSLVFLLALVAMDFITPLNAADELKTLNASHNHILANVDELIDTTQFKLDGGFGDIILNTATLTSTDPKVTITATSITVSDKGVFPILITKNATQLTIYVITKLTAETEYVIYQEDFSSYANGAIPNSLKMFNNLGNTGGSAAISNQRLMLSPSTIVLFPSYLNSFSNYIIEADMKMASASDARRWTSVMFRYATENYYQMAIRQDASASSGVEFAKRSPGSWNVPSSTVYTEALDPAKTYQLKLDVFETTVEEYINDTLLITYDSLFEYSKGAIGVQADNVTVYYDNIKITLPEDYVSEDRFEFTQITNVYQPVTNIVAPATTLMWFNELSDLDIALDPIRPATMIFRVNAALEVLNSSGAVISNATDVLIAIDGKIIPAFYTDDLTTGEKVAGFLRINRILDVFLVSEKSDVILASRAIHNVIRGVKLYTLPGVETLTESDLMDIRRETNRAQAVASILPSTLLNRDLVFYMQHRLMTVWASSSDDQPALLHTILTGVNGILAQDYNEIFDIYSSFPANTHVRRPLMIAHRGLYEGGAATAENTIETGFTAIEKGADVIELDVHLTSDLEVVVMHDGTTARTAPDFDSLTLATSTLAQLKAMYLRDPQDVTRKDLKIPTLRELLTAFKGSGVVIFIEIKPTNSLLNLYVKNIVEELDVFDQAVIIAFGQQNIKDFNEYYPEIANGWLNSGVINADNLNSSLLNVISNIVPINSTFNPNYSPLTLEFTNNIIHRGLTVWPWTIDDSQHLINYYNYGVGGITTNYIGNFEDTFNRIQFEEREFSYVIDKTSPFEINASIATPSGTVYPIKPEYTILDPDSTGLVLNVDGTLDSVDNPGDAYAYTVFSASLPNGSNINLASELLHFSISEPQTYDVSFETNGGNTISKVTVEEDNNLTLTQSPTKVGYTFGGWYLDSALTTKVGGQITPTAHITLYAKWEMITYDINFNTVGGNTIASKTINYGQKITLPDQPTKDGYVFNGWFLDNTLETAHDSNFVPTGNTTLYASWTQNSKVTPLGIVSIIIGSSGIIAGGIFLSLRFAKLKKI